MSHLLLWAALTIPFAGGQTGGFAMKAALAADQIRHGDAAERANAVRGVMADPALLDDEDIRAAVAGELARVATEIRARRADARAAARPRSEVVDDRREYWTDLQDVALRMNDPRFVDPLLWFVGTSSPVSTWLAGFGEQIVPAIVARYDDECFAGGTCPDLLKLGLLGTAARALAATRGRDAQQAIIGLAARALGETSDWQALTGGITIAAESCDAGLLATLTQIAAPDSALGIAGAWPGRIRGEAADAVAGCRAR